jgi:hypothetical protein
MATVRTTCPSCEATVLLKDEKLLGAKVECPKCKYRFKAEAAAGQPAPAPAPAAAAAAVAAAEGLKKPKPDGKKGKKKLLIGVGVGLAAVVLLAVGGFVLFGGGDKKPPGTAGGPGPRPAGTAPKTPNPAGGTEEGGAEDGREGGADAPKGPAPAPVAKSDKDPTNLLPNDAVAVYRFDLDKVRVSPVGQPLLDPAVVELLRTSTGLEPTQLERYIHCVVGPADRAPFGVLRLKDPVDPKVLIGRLAGAGAPRAVNGRPLHPVADNKFLTAVGNALSYRGFVGDLYEAPPPAPPSAARPLGACPYDSQTLLVGDYDALERFLAGLKADGYPEFQTEWRKEVPQPPDEPQEADPSEKEGKEAAPPAKKDPARPVRDYTTNPNYLSVSPELKRLLNGIEDEPPPPTGTPIVLAAEKWDNAAYPRKGLRKEYEPVAAVVGPVLDKARYVGAALWVLDYRRVVATVRVVGTTDEEMRALAVETISPGLTKAADALSLLLSNTVTVRNFVNPEQGTDAGGSFGQGGLFAPPFAGGGGMRPPFAGGGGPPVGGGDSLGGSASRPPFAPGAPGGGYNPGGYGPGMMGGSMSRPPGAPGGSYNPGGYGPGMMGGSGGGYPQGYGGRGSGSYNPGGYGPGMMGGTGGGLGGDDLGGMGGPPSMMSMMRGMQGMMPGGGSPYGGPPGMATPGGAQGPNPQQPDPAGGVQLDPPHIDLRQNDNVLTLFVELNWPEEEFAATVAPRLFGLVNQVKGKAAVYAGQHTWHSLADAVRKYVADKKAFPRGTFESGRAEPKRLQLPYPPVRRVSFIAELLPYLGREAVARGVNPGKAWFDENNLIAAEAWVPELLVPYYPPAAWRATSPLAPAHTFGGTNYVAVAGVGLDAAWQLDPKNPAHAKLAGITGYDWGSKVEEVADGLANTIYLLQVPPGFSRPWAAGGGATVMGLDPKDPMAAFKHRRADGKEGTYAIMADGTVRWIPADIKPEYLLAMATRAGGEKLPDLDEIAPRVEPEAAKAEVAAAAGKADEVTPAAPAGGPDAPAKAAGGPPAVAPEPREKGADPGKE